MNRKTLAKPLATLAIAAALLGAAPAQAAEPTLRERAATLVGQYIAQQGNAALIQIRNEVKQDLADALRPLLPAPEAPAARVDAPAAAAKN